MKCAATNKLGTNFSSSLVIFSGDNDRFFIEYNGSPTIYAGDNITITCVVINPLFNIALEWYLDDKRIGEFSEEIKNTSEGPEHRIQLTWPEIQVNDSGKYECRKNLKDYGYSLSTFYRLSVDGSLTIYHTYLK